VGPEWDGDELCRRLEESAFEQTIVANATGFGVPVPRDARGLEVRATSCRLGNIYDIDNCVDWGHRDYVVGTPLPKVYAWRNTPILSSQHYLNLYKMVKARSTPSLLLIICVTSSAERHCAGWCSVMR